MSIQNLLIDLNAAEDLPRLDVVLAPAADPGAAERTAVAAGGVMRVREREIRTAFLFLPADLAARVEDLRPEWRGDVVADRPLPCLSIH